MGLLINVSLAWQQWHGLRRSLVLRFGTTNLCCLSVPELKKQKDLLALTTD